MVTIVLEKIDENSTLTVKNPVTNEQTKPKSKVSIGLQLN